MLIFQMHLDTRFGIDRRQLFPSKPSRDNPLFEPREFEVLGGTVGVHPVGVLMYPHVASGASIPRRPASPGHQEGLTRAPTGRPGSGGCGGHGRRGGRGWLGGRRLSGAGRGWRVGRRRGGDGDDFRLDFGGTGRERESSDGLICAGLNWARLSVGLGAGAGDLVLAAAGVHDDVEVGLAWINLLNPQEKT